MKFLLVLTTVSLFNVSYADNSSSYVGERSATVSETTTACCTECNKDKTNPQDCSERAAETNNLQGQTTIRNTSEARPE